MRPEDFCINERGIYSCEKAYGDALDYTWYVEFDKEDLDEQFYKFMKKVFEYGGDERATRIRALLGARGTQV